MSEIWQSLEQMATAEKLLGFGRALFLVAVGVVLAFVVSRALGRLVAGRLDVQRATLLRRAAYFLLLGIFLLAALHEMGFNLGVLLGAAGILSVAVGFASQTSASNVISGLFLMAEAPFAVGDIIQVGGTTGEVLSVDLLSVKLRTYDNLFVRIPNETLIKAEVKTLTRFPIRRADLEIGVAYKEDLRRVREVLGEVANKNPLCLEEPKPLFILRGFGDSSMDIQFSVWVKRENFLELRNSIQEEIKAAFDAAGIEIPFPHISVYAGSATEALPVKLVAPGPETGLSDGRTPAAGEGPT